MAMRLALKKIVDVLKASKPIQEIDGYQTSIRNPASFKKFITKNCVKLRNPVPIKAGTKWTSKSSSGTIHGTFEVDCNVIGVVNYIGWQLVLDECSSRSEMCRKDGGELDFLEMLSLLSNELLEKIAEEV